MEIKDLINEAGYGGRRPSLQFESAGVRNR